MPIPPDFSDHLHSFGNCAGSICPLVDFNYPTETSTAEPLIPLSSAASALSRIFEWVGHSQDWRFAGAKIIALHVLLDPINGPYRNLSQVARAAGISRATLSKAILNLRDLNGIRFAGGKSQLARQTYRETQLMLVANGRHASQKSRKEKTGENVPRGNLTGLD
jgi:hypothetical protein